MGTVTEDYVHGHMGKLALLFFSSAFAWSACILCVFAILMMMFESAAGRGRRMCLKKASTALVCAAVENAPRLAGHRGYLQFSVFVPFAPDVVEPELLELPVELEPLFTSAHPLVPDCPSVFDGPAPEVPEPEPVPGATVAPLPPLESDPEPPPDVPVPPEVPVPDEPDEPLPDVPVPPPLPPDDCAIADVARPRESRDTVRAFISIDLLRRFRC